MDDDTLQRFVNLCLAVTLVLTIAGMAALPIILYIWGDR